MKKLIAFVLMIFLTSVSAASMIYPTHTYYCERNWEACAQDIAEKNNSTGLEKMSIEGMVFSSESRTTLIYTNSSSFSEKSRYKTGFYPAENYSERELRKNSGCWETEIEKKKEFYRVDWQQTDEIYCIEGVSFNSANVEPVYNLFKNPLGFASALLMNIFGMVLGLFFS